MSYKIAHQRIATAAMLSLLLLVPGQLARAEEPPVNAPASGQQVEQIQMQSDEPKANAAESEPGTNEASEEAKADKSKVLNVSGYTQLRYDTFDVGLDGGESDEGFDITRARVKLSLKPGGRFGTVLQVDCYDEGEFKLKDLYAVYNLPQKREFAIGQMKWPFGYEVTNSSSDRETPERALVFKRLFPGQRDRGATIEGRFNKDADWIIGLFDGSGIQEVNEETFNSFGLLTGMVSKSITSDYNGHKDIVGRAVFDRGHAEFGISGYVGKGIWNKKRTQFLDEPKDRYGADFRYSDNKWALKTEYVRARGVDETDKDFNYSDWISGYYAQLSYGSDTGSMLVARYSSMSQDPNEPQFGRRSAWDLGWLRWLNSRSRVRIFYQINHEAANPVDNNGLTAEWMVVY